jgi:arylsulfatase A-like enzyme
MEGRVEGSLKSNVEYIDVLIKRIVEGLENENLWDHTILVFTGDNGTSGYGKGNIQEERGPKVPMMFSSGKLIKGLGKIDALMDFSDLLPTFCDIAGTQLPEDEVFDGHSVLPILKGETNDIREWIFSYYSDYRMLRDKRWLLDGNDTFYDCAEAPGTYLDVTDSTDPEVSEAKKRFEQILRNLPGPTKEQVENLSFTNQGRNPPLKYEYE